MVAAQASLPVKRSTFSAAAGPLTEIAIASAAIAASNLLMYQTSLRGLPQSSAARREMKGTLELRRSADPEIAATMQVRTQPQR
jgi:hypothetical protein